ncbi:hypothetical protein CDAR_307301 [Caerostris darwini]|uniref:Uncharacterized protein n=1 Tax=Caerostris darwini TaxID=1538125 RepID=A0AAV4T855_9ARAC|nr:hypothetical protein CDAR_307301 [Caerostris darwini]
MHLLNFSDLHLNLRKRRTRNSNFLDGAVIVSIPARIAFKLFNFHKSRFRLQNLTCAISKKISVSDNVFTLCLRVLLQQRNATEVERNSIDKEKSSGDKSESLKRPVSELNDSGKDESKQKLQKTDKDEKSNGDSKHKEEEEEDDIDSKDEDEDVGNEGEGEDFDEEEGDEDGGEDEAEEDEEDDA